MLVNSSHPVQWLIYFKQRMTLLKSILGLIINRKRENEEDEQKEENQMMEKVCEGGD